MLVNGLLVYQDTAFTQKAIALQMALEVTEGMPLGFFFFFSTQYPLPTSGSWTHPCKLHPISTLKGDMEELAWLPAWGEVM